MTNMFYCACSCGCKSSMACDLMTACGTVGACLIAIASFSFRWIPTLWRKPLLSFVPMFFGETCGEGDSAKDNSASSDVSKQVLWLRVNNGGKRNADQCRIKCDEIFYKMQGNELFTEMDTKILPFSFTWQDGKDFSNILYGSDGLCKIAFYERKMRIVDMVTQYHSRVKSFKEKLDSAFYLNTKTMPRIKCQENSILIKLSVHYCEIDKHQSVYLHVHWPNHTDEVNDATLWCKVVEPSDAEKLIQLKSLNGGLK